MAKNITVSETDHKAFKHLAIEMGVSGMALFNEMLKAFQTPKSKGQ